MSRNCASLRALLRTFLPLLITVILTSCGTSRQAFVCYEDKDWSQQPLPSLEPAHTVFLVGDAGKAELGDPSPAFVVLKRQLDAVGENSSLIFLGDNIYPAGLPQKDDPGRAEAELHLDAQLEVANDFKGQPFMVPGNHDWNRWSKGGRKAVKRQEDYVEEKWNRGNTYRPDEGCADPERVKLSNGLVMIFIDSQWWLHDHNEEKHMTRGCDIKSRTHFLEDLEAMIRQNKNKQIIMVMHHPMHSNGHHGGYFSFKDHVFPMTQAQKSLYIPLPVIGSILPIWRKLGGTTQDIPHEQYKLLRSELEQVTSAYSDIIFAAGHEHSLQYHYEGSHHFVVSGSGSKTGYTRKGKGASYARDANGFAKLYYYENGETWLEMIVPNEDGSEGIVEFRKQLVPARLDQGDEKVYNGFDPLPDSVSVSAAGDFYDVSGVGKILVGDQYREAWGQEVDVPVIDLETEYGGMTPIKKGGGLASNSLRLETEEGKQYALRSVDKNVSKAIPQEVRDLEILGLLQDQIAAIHPYGAVVIPPLAEAVGVYHTNPKVVYLKHQERLGLYNDLFPEATYLLEEHLTGDRSELESFGASDNIICYIDLLEMLKQDQNLVIDEQWVLKSRLFDLFIHDWHRHDDQWRWAEIKTEDAKVWRPIPRDRDQAFYKFKGAMPWFVTSFVIRKFGTFKDDLKRPWWQSFDARYFDRYFLTEMDREDWERTVREMQAALTDEVIESAFSEWPVEIQELDASEIIERLKARRDNLHDISMRHYEYLSHTVSVVGSDEGEVFEVERLENGNTRVQVFERSKEGKKKGKLYDRVFEYKITKEIRIYGLNGEDDFQVDGKARKGAKIRIIGGEGDDLLKDNSTMGGLVKKTHVYDTPDGIKMEEIGPETLDRTSNDFDINEYDREDFQFNSGLPVISLGYNIDEQFFVGAGYTWVTHGFRKVPYKRNHKIWANIAPTTRAFNASYEGDFREAFRIFDFHLEATINNPGFVNYFGTGNTTDTSLFNRRGQFNWVRIDQTRVYPKIKKTWASNRFRLAAGPSIERFAYGNPSDEEIRIAEAENSPIPASDLDERWYLGVVANLEFESVDIPAIPQEGLKFDVGLNYRNELNSENTFTTLHGSMAFYLTFGNRVRLTVANRLGIGTYIGDTSEVPFYLEQSIGGTSFLRGFRRDRFRGKTAFSHAIDLRLHLANWDNSILPMDVGLVGGFDYGRVWHPIDADRQRLHQGYVAGLYLAPLSTVALVPFMSYSQEQDWLFNFSLGFSF